ncbi:serine hydrolase FSH [Crucibulum laeve]|uniref:Serine hydrolase FSH n=1 Tax=Crucibulum laeve TaxID=68775 RepID=A0A5C3ML52_9AGAR|nr:serine hydrolase FSH [Crucibulum laeve]
MMAAAKRTVLVLHGYSQNASVFSRRLGALRKEAKDVDMVFIDAPHILQPADLFNSSQQSQSEAQSGLLSEVQQNQATIAATDPSLSPRAWWKANADRTKAVGMEESIAVVRDVLKGRRFDGVLGFSQGAAFAAIIAALLERPHLYPDFLIDGQPPHPPLQFCIAVSGFRVNDPICDPIFTPSYSTPTLHIIGKTDIVVVEERSKQLVDMSSNKRVEEHEGGHFVPSKGNWRKFLAEYMRDPFATLVSPGSSAPPSGTATPTGGNESALMMKL